MLSVPIREGDLVVGVINATDKEGDQPFTLDDERVIEEFQSHAALLIQHARMRERLAQTIRVKEQLTRMLVHDLKGPLAAIMANLDMLLLDLTALVPASAGDAASGDAAEMLDASRASCNTLMQMVLNLLDLARAGDDASGDPAGPTSGRLSGALGSGGRSLTRALPAQLSVSPVMTFLEEQRPVLEAIGRHRSVQVRVTVAPDTPRTIAFDPALLSRVLLNLTMNAVEHTPLGQEVTIHCGPGEVRPLSSISITVSDDGIGVPIHMRQSIFDAYFTTKSADQGVGLPKWEGLRIFERFRRGENPTVQKSRGMGLGLYICNSIIAAHGGRIEVDSEVGEGSRFTFILPV